MNVLYALDKGFKARLIVSVNSLIKNTSKPLNVFIVFDGMDQKSYEYLSSLANERVKIRFLKAPKISDRLIPDRGAQSQFYRLYITKIFQNFPKIKRVLYLDCDTLVTSKEIENFLNIDMNSNAIAATVDPWSRYYKMIFNLKKDTNMFNAGILLIDIKNWENQNYDKKLKNLITNRKHFIQADQGLLNELINGEFKILEPKFNAISSYFEMTYDELICYRKPVNFYSKKEIADAQENPVIVHFTSTFLCNRPWQRNSRHSFKNQWVGEASNYQKVMFKSLSSKQKILKGLFYFLPKRVSINLFGILQAYVRPMLLRMKL